jgi:hypothetical protein
MNDIRREIDLNPRQACHVFESESPGKHQLPQNIIIGI